MAISSISNNRSFPGVTVDPELPGKGSARQSIGTGAVKNRETLPPVTDGFDGLKPVALSKSTEAGPASVVDQLRGADSFETCAPEPAVALTLPNGAVVGADLIDAKGVSKDSNGVGSRVDGQDCSTTGEAGKLI